MPRARPCAIPIGGLCCALWALFSLGCGGQEPAPEPPQRPLNVLLVTIDTLRADALGAYGQQLPTSPRLDALAARGAVFEQCVTSAPMTLPSHASIMTGKQPYAHGARSNSGYLLPPEHVTLAEVLRDHGYRTAAEIAAPVIGRRTLMNQGFEQYRDLESGDVNPLRVNVGDEKRTLIERSAADIARFGIDFVRNVGDAPFFLWLHFFDPHVFYNPPQIFAELVPDSRYHAEVRYTDAELGQVLIELDRQGLAEDTLVVVTSDHGESLGEHGEPTHSYFVYDATMRVPLILWNPRVVPQGARVPSLVRTIDIAPTILDLLDLPPLEGIQGVSLRPLLDEPGRDLALTGYGEAMQFTQLFGSSLLRFTREGGWKYVHKVSPELFDLGRDPDELENLVESRPEVAARLRDRLDSLVAAAPQIGNTAVGDLDPQTAAHLEALGYVATAPLEDFDELSSLEVTGSDPNTLIDDALLHSRGIAMLKTHRLDEAEEIYRDLYSRHPESAPVVGSLAAVLKARGERDELEALLESALDIPGGGIDFRFDLAGMKLEEGDYLAAERLLAEALERETCSVKAWVRLANTLHRQERYAEQLETLEVAVERCPDAPDLRNDLAYALATTPDDSLRDGRRALQLAQGAVAETGANPAYLDTLACAYAETQAFLDARRTLRRAIEILEARGVPEEALALFRAHLTSIEAGEPVRHAAGA